MRTTAKTPDGKPPETRGARGKSQRIRDLNDQLRAMMEVGGGIPKWVEAIGVIGILTWLLISMRPRVDVYGDAPIPPDPPGWATFLPRNGITFSYKGRAFSKIIIAHPYGRSGPFILGEIVMLLNLPSGDWFELAEDALAFAFLHDLYDNALFPEMPIDFANEYNLDTYKGTYPIDVGPTVARLVGMRWLSVLGFAGFLLLLIHRGVIPRS